MSVYISKKKKEFAEASNKSFTEYDFEKKLEEANWKYNAFISQVTDLIKSVLPQFNYTVLTPRYGHLDFQIQAIFESTDSSKSKPYLDYILKSEIKSSEFLFTNFVEVSDQVYEAKTVYFQSFHNPSSHRMNIRFAINFAIKEVSISNKI